MVNYTASEENYIKSIYHLQGDQDLVTTNALAAELQTRPASVTDMLKKLKQKKLLLYEKYQGFKLSPEGRKVALGIIRRHRLWEYFLSVKLQFSWEEVHEVAEELEHVRSSKLVEKLDEFLGFPRFDPHGDPIPDHEGRIPSTECIPLTGLPIGKVAEVGHVSNQSTEMLDLLSHYNIGIGTRLEVKKRYTFDHSMEIKIRNFPAFMISEQLAQNILVKYGRKS